VFSGLWRLGAVSAARILGVQPDIACYAKLLTGAPALAPYVMPALPVGCGLSTLS